MAASLTAGLTQMEAQTLGVEDPEDEVEDLFAVTDVTAKVIKSKTVLPPTLNNNSTPLYAIQDLNLPIPTSDIPNFHIASLKNFCFTEDYEHYKRLYDIQSDFLSSYSPAYSIHSLTAINFYKNILNAPSFVLQTLTFGYQPGRLWRIILFTFYLLYKVVPQIFLFTIILHNLSFLSFYISSVTVFREEQQ